MYTQKFVDSEACNHCMDETDSFGNQPDNFNLKKFIKKANPITGFATILNPAHIIANTIKKGKTIVKATKAYNPNSVPVVVNAVNTAQTESLSTPPGQIGTEAGAITQPSYAAQQLQTSGGGAGDVPMDNSLQDTTLGQPETSTASNPTELDGVLLKPVGKTNWLMIAIIVIIAAGGLYFILKTSKNK